MADPTGAERQQHIVQIVTTEHFTLQTGRGITVAEANGRVGVYLSTVSTTLVALAFIGQMSHLGPAFYLFGLILFASVFFLGLFTFARVLQSGLEDAIYLRGINRIRHYYLEMLPEMAPYFILSTHDDERGGMRDFGIRRLHPRVQGFLTTAGLVAVIDSIVAGAFVGLLVGLLVSLLALAVGAGVVTFLLCVVAHQRYQATQWAALDQTITPLFPSPTMKTPTP
jgi:hypothetical protein